MGSDGELAQLGERLLCKQEVTGSIPVFSTCDSKERAAQGWWMYSAMCRGRGAEAESAADEAGHRKHPGREGAPAGDGQRFFDKRIGKEQGGE